MHVGRCTFGCVDGIVDDGGWTKSGYRARRRPYPLRGAAKAKDRQRSLSGNLWKTERVWSRKYGRPPWWGAGQPHMGIDPRQAMVDWCGVDGGSIRETWILVAWHEQARVSRSRVALLLPLSSNAPLLSHERGGHWGSHPPLRPSVHSSSASVRNRGFLSMYSPTPKSRFDPSPFGFSLGPFPSPARWIWMPRCRTIPRSRTEHARLEDAHPSISPVVDGGICRTDGNDRRDRERERKEKTRPLVEVGGGGGTGVDEEMGGGGTPITPPPKPCRMKPGETYDQGSKHVSFQAVEPQGGHGKVDAGKREQVETRHEKKRNMYKPILDQTCPDTWTAWMSSQESSLEGKKTSRD